jgi:predicted metal-dependent RNase
MDILKTIKEKLPGEVSDASFEGANIVLYTENQNFLKDDRGKIREVVNEIKKRIELRADPKILLERLFQKMQK